MPRTIDSNIYFIGGPARCGKSTVAQKFITKNPILSASTDAIRSAAKSMTTPRLNPELFKQGRGKFDSENNRMLMATDFDEALNFELMESIETWKATIAFLEYYIRDGRDALIEGVAVVPELVSKLDYKHRAVFVVNLADQTDTILSHARSNSHDWLSKYDDSTIKAFCKYNQKYNKFFAEQAKKYNYPVVDMQANNFVTSVNEAVDILLG